MTAEQNQGDSTSAPVKMITTDTGRILRVTPADEAARAASTAAPTVTAAKVDPARRADVLFRKRRADVRERSTRLPRVTIRQATLSKERRVMSERRPPPSG